jgi:hypothetical protein
MATNIGDDDAFLRANAHISCEIHWPSDQGLAASVERNRAGL